MGFLPQLFSSDFMPHGYCYLWDPRIVWLNVISDGLITLSYYCIPIVLVYFARKNRDLTFNRISWMFGAFILACGTTHLMEVWNIWHANYLAAGIIKAITAIVSVLTAAAVVPLVPQAIALPARIRLEEVNRQIELRIAERKRLDNERSQASLGRDAEDLSRCDPRIVRRLSAFAAVSAVFSMAVGLSGLAAWKLHIASLKNWGVGLATMKPNTAACFMLLGMALWLLRKNEAQPASQARRFSASSLAAVVGLVSLLSLVEYFLARNFGIDALLAASPPSGPTASPQPGLMSAITAADFLMLSLALLLADWKTKRGDWPSQFLCLGAAVGAGFGLLALIIAPAAAYTTVALPTAVTFFVAAGGLVSSRAPWALGGLFTSPSPGARLLRRAAPAAFLVLGLVGWTISKALLTEVHFSWVEVSTLAILCGAMLAGFITWIAFIVDRSEVQRKKIENALNFSHDQLDRLMERVEEPEAEAVLRRRVTIGFTVAVVLTVLLGFFSWRNSQQAAEDAGWVSRAHEVSTALELTLRHLVDVETGGRGFAITGDPQFLEPYTAGKLAIGQDLQKLRGLIVDPDQKLRLDVLVGQAMYRIEEAEQLVTARQITEIAPGVDLLGQGKRAMDAARATVSQMEAEENTVLEQRTRRTRTAQHFAGSVNLAASFFGVVFLSIAGATVRREVGISARARAQINRLNADLELRVAQRTEALGESEGRLAGVIQSAMDAIITVDEKQRIMLFNGAAERMFRCSMGDALEQPISRFIPPRFHAAHAGHIRQFGDNGVTNRAMGPKDVLWAVRADGQEFQIEASISQAVTGGKKLFTVIMRDVTERVQAEQMHERLAAVVDSSDDAIIAKTLDGTIAAWNRGAEKIFGYSAAEIVGKPMLILIPAERVDEESDILARIRRGEGVEHFETIRLRKDGRKIDVSVTISPIRDGSGAVIGASKIARDITERKQAEETLRESDARRKFALETAKLGDWELDLTTLQASRSLLHDQIFGYPSLRPEWNFDIFLGHIHPQDRERVRENFQSCASQGKRWEFECRIVCPNGDTRWIWACGDCYRGLSGGAARMFGIVEDVTERKRADEALRESEERFQAMANGIPQLAWMAEADGSIFWYNQRWYDYTGTTFEQMRGWGWQSVHAPERLAMVLERWKGSIAAGIPFEMEFPLRGADGSFRIFLTRAMPSKDGQGRVVRWFGTNTDISERKQAEGRMAAQAEELARSREALEAQTLLLRSVLDSMGEGLVAADEEGRFVIWNPAADKIVGMSAASVPASEWTSHYGLFLPDTVTPFPTEQNPLARAIGGEASTAEMFVRNPELAEGVWIEASGRPLKDAHGAQHGGVVAFRDVTQRKKAEREIRELNEELEERVAERTAQLEGANKELEAFTYSVSHDLRAPLRHIAGFSGILSEEFGSKLEPQAQHYLKRIAEGTRKMGELVDELLCLARVGRQTPNLQVAGLDSIVGEVVALLKPEYEGRKVEWRIAQLPFVECDPVLMKQVFQNLISNAIKYSRPRAEAVIEIGRSEMPGGESAVFVRDNGVGFSMKYVDKLFGVFQRLHRAEDFEGTGVGLATVQRIIQKHGGRVWAEAELDRGATFYFTLSSAGRKERPEAAAAMGSRA